MSTEACLNNRVHPRRFMKGEYTSFILSTPGKVTVLLGSVGLFAAGVYGVTQVIQSDSDPPFFPFFIVAEF